MPIVDLPPMIALECDGCGERASADGYDYAVYEASAPEDALSQAAFRRVGDAILCDDCPDDAVSAQDATDADG